MRLHLKWDVREISGVTQCWKALLAFYRKVLRFIHLATATAPTMEIANNVVAVVFALDLHAKSSIRSNVTILWWKKILLSIAIAVTIVYRIHSMMTPLLPSQCERAFRKSSAFEGGVVCDLYWAVQSRRTCREGGGGIGLVLWIQIWRGRKEGWCVKWLGWKGCVNWIAYGSISRAGRGKLSVGCVNCRYSWNKV